MSPFIRNARRRERGFSLLEILVATSLLVVGMTGILALYVKAMELESEAERRTDIALVLPEALRRIEQIVAAPTRQGGAGSSAMRGEIELVGAGGSYRCRYVVEEAGEAGVLFASVQIVVAAGTGNEMGYDFGRLPVIPEPEPPGPRGSSSAGALK